MKNALKKIISLAMILVFIIPNYSYADDKSVDKYSKTSILIDQETGRVLYSKEPDMKVPLASLSKMMTFLLAIEAIENKEVKETDKVKIDKSIASVKGSSYKLKDGEEVPLIELMRGLMIVSGNDAAIAIAKHVCKTKEAFVDRMNKKAKEIGADVLSIVTPWYAAASQDEIYSHFKEVAEAVDLPIVLYKWSSNIRFKQPQKTSKRKYLYCKRYSYSWKIHV